MDIEGAEYRVLKDLLPLLRIKKKPIIFLSTHGDDIRTLCLDLMVKLNYRITPLDDSNLDIAREFLLEPFE